MSSVQGIPPQPSLHPASLGEREGKSLACLRGSRSSLSATVLRGPHLHPTLTPGRRLAEWSGEDTHRQICFPTVAGVGLAEVRCEPPHEEVGQLGYAEVPGPEGSRQRPTALGPQLLGSESLGSMGAVCT